MNNVTNFKNINELNFDNSVDILLRQILKSAKDMTSSDAGTIYLRKEDRLNFFYSENDTLAKRDGNLYTKYFSNKYLCLLNQRGYAAVDATNDKKIINIDDIYKSQDYDFIGSKHFDKNLEYKSKSMLVVPILDMDNNVICVIQLINKKDDNNEIISFCKQDEKIVHHMGELSSVSIYKIQKYINELQVTNLKLQQVNDELLYLNEKLEEKVIQRTLELEKITKTDFLTGINNRRVFFEEGNTKFESGCELYVGIVDIDKFKEVNDIHGHLAGDIILKCFTKIIEENILDDVLFARIGGEEFALMYCNYSRDEVVLNINNIKKSIEDKKIEISNEKTINITASFGIAKKYKSDCNLDDVMCRADLALYKSKDDGRNRVNFRR